jgi:hypothetical protein
MSARERCASGALESEVRNRRVLPKGTYGRHTALRNGDCFRGLVNRGGSPTGKPRNPTRTEGLRRNVIFARLWGGRGLKENRLAGRIPLMSAVVSCSKFLTSLIRACSSGVVRRPGNLTLTDQEEDTIVSFLKTLTDGYTVPNERAAKWLCVARVNTTCSITIPRATHSEAIPRLSSSAT